MSKLQVWGLLVIAHRVYEVLLVHKVFEREWLW